MLTDRTHFLALHLRWFVGFVVALGAAAGWYASAARSQPRWPGGSSAIGLVLGTLAALIILFECALWVRKTRWLRTSRILGSAQLWMKAHIWLGLLVAPLALLHSGFSFGGPFTSALMWVLIGVVVSGLFGLLMQNLVPRWMLEHVPGETIYSQITLVKHQYADEAARIVYLSCGLSASPTPAMTAGQKYPEASPQDRDDGLQVVGAPRRVGAFVARSPEGTAMPRLDNPQPLWQAYEQVVRPFLAGSSRPATRLTTRRRSQEYFAALRAGIGQEAHEAVAALEQLCDRARDLNLQKRLHLLLHSWLVVHLPLSASLLILLVVHILYALRIG